MGEVFDSEIPGGKKHPEEKNFQSLSEYMFDLQKSKEIEIYSCSLKGRTDLMQEACEQKDKFMISALRSSESYKELMSFSDRIKYHDRAVVLIPGSGYHIAAEAEMAEVLFKKHKLEEVEFIHTEIDGLPMLRDFEKALFKLAEMKGWSFNRKYFQPNHKIEGAFESVYTITTPYGTLKVRFKNSMSGKDFYSDEDLQRANFLVVHDLEMSPVKTRDFVNDAVEKKQDKNNFIVISEDFTRPRRDGYYSGKNNPTNVVHLEHPYGCAGSYSHVQETHVVLTPSSYGEEPVDISEMGLMDPRLVYFANLGYSFEIDKKNKKVICTNTDIYDLQRSKSFYKEHYYRGESSSEKSKEWEAEDEKDFFEELKKPLICPG